MSTFLYKTGDECIDITGGFISCPYTLTGTSVEVIKNSDNIQLNPNGAGRHTSLSHNTAINLTEYKSIYFDIEVVSTLGGNQWTRLGLSTNNNQNDYGVGEVTIENTVGRKLYHIDLTDKTDLAFVKAHINCGTGAVSPFMNIKIYNIWLEKNLEKLPTSSSLVDTVEHVKNVNDEIYFLKAKLENNLIAKGVECSDTDKMSSLINKVGNIIIEKHKFPQWFSGTDFWIKGCAMPTYVSEPTVSSVGTKIYSIGGTVTLYTNINYCYDSLTNTWSQKSNMPTSRAYLTSSTVGDKIYCIGGWQSGSTYLNKNECYDTITNTWTTKANMPTARRLMSSSVVGNNIYCINGANSYTSNKNECYDTITNTWTTKANALSSPSSTTERISSCAVDNKIYCIYGYDQKNECYDTVTNTWSTKTSTSKRYNGTMCSIGTDIYFIGGRDGNNIVSTNECYDTLTDTWSLKNNIVEAMEHLKSAVIDNHIYCIKNYNSGSGTNNGCNLCYII